MPNNSLTPNNPRFTEIIAGLLHELFRAAGVSMVPLKGHERIREVARKLSETIEHHAEVKAVEVAKILQVGVRKAFTSMEKVFDEQMKVVEQSIREYKPIKASFRAIEKEFKLQKEKLDSFKTSLQNADQERHEAVQREAMSTGNINEQKVKADKLEQKLETLKQELKTLKQTVVKLSDRTPRRTPVSSTNYKTYPPKK